MTQPSPAVLTVDILKRDAGIFAREESMHAEPSIYGTYLEQKFRAYVVPRYTSLEGNSAKGIDIREIRWGTLLKNAYAASSRAVAHFQDELQKSRRRSGPIPFILSGTAARCYPTQWMVPRR